jgi:glycerophosphoryl diester phosphodiesterase
MSSSPKTQSASTSSIGIVLRTVTRIGFSDSLSSSFIANRSSGESKLKSPNSFPFDKSSRLSLGDMTYHPAPAVFARLLYDEIIKSKMQKQVTIQSFDVRTLQEFRKFTVKMPLVLLVENKDGIEKNIEKLGFQPDVYSPHFSLVDELTVKYCREKKIKIIPWTVNETADMERMKKLALDGIITDYPDRAIKVFRN